MNGEKKRLRWRRHVILGASLAAAALLVLWVVRRAAVDNVSALGVRLADTIGGFEEYEPAALEPMRQAGPDALPLLIRALGARDTPGYARVYDWIASRLTIRPLASLVRFLPQPVRNAESQRAAAARFLEALGEDAAQARDALVRAMDDESPRVNWRASMALLRLGGSAELVLASQRRRLANPGSGHPAGAAFLLARLGPPARAEVPLILSALSRSTNTEDVVGLLSLPWILQDTPLDPPAQSFGELIQRTPRRPGDAVAWGRIEAALEPLRAEVFRGSGPGPGPGAGTNEVAGEIDPGTALGIMMLGPVCSNVVPVLREQLSSADPEKRLAAGLAWWHVTGDRAGSARALAGAEHLDDETYQLAFLLTMQELGAAAVPAATNVAGYLVSSNALFRRIAARVVGGVGEAGRFSVPELERCLNDPCLGLRLDAAEAIWKLTRDGRRIVPVIAPLLEDRSPRRRGQAARLLVRIGDGSVPPDILARARAAPPAAPDEIPSVFEVLLRMLSDGD